MFGQFPAGWPQTLENRENMENGKKKFPAGKIQGIWKIDENQGKIREFEIKKWHFLIMSKYGNFKQVKFRLIEISFCIFLENLRL